MKVIAVGDNCIDNYAKQEKRYAGGCSVNFSVYMSQLGLDSAYLGAVGNDENGTFMLNTMKACNVDVSRVHILPGRTAVTEVELEDSERHFVGYEEGVLGQLTLGEIDFSYIETFDYLHTSVFGKIDKYLPRLKGKVKICYDFADKFGHDNLKQTLCVTDYAFFSYDRDDAYIRDLLKWAHGHGMIYAVATLGSKGSIAYDGTTYYKYGTKKVTVVDTIGAGDSFLAGFMYGVSLEKGVQKCLEAGAKKAEETIGYMGAF